MRTGRIRRFLPAERPQSSVTALVRSLAWPDHQSWATAGGQRAMHAAFINRVPRCLGVGLGLVLLAVPWTRCAAEDRAAGDRAGYAWDVARFSGTPQRNRTDAAIARVHVRDGQPGPELRGQAPDRSNGDRP